MKSNELLSALEEGRIRTAELVDGAWVVNTSVKEQILGVFQAHGIVRMPGGFQDKSLLTTQYFHPSSGIRLVPGGSAVRSGAYVADRVIIMPPAYVNIGAYVDEGTMIDSHVLVGSCAQVGK